MKLLKTITMVLFVLSTITFSQEKIDKMPTIKGGIEELAKNIKYPKSAEKDGIMGKVIVKAIIDEKGDVVDAEIIKSDDKKLNDAAINAVKITKFVPGENDGKKVKAEVTIPISFKLDNQEK